MKVIVVTGAGRAFCAGADFDLLSKIGTKKMEQKEISDAHSIDMAVWPTAAAPKP